MTTQPPIHVRANGVEIEGLVAALAPLVGGIWLATDINTQIHWTIPAGSLTRVIDAADARVCRAFGLVTVCAPNGEPVFLINERDTLDWIVPDLALAVRELGQESCEIRLERLDDLDARLIDAANICGCDAESSAIRTIRAGNACYLQICDDQISSGDEGADAALRSIETTIDARRRLVGPAAGTLDVMEQMARDLDAILRERPVRSFIWAAVLREQIDAMRQSLAA